MRKTGQIAHVSSSSSGIAQKKLSFCVTLLRRLVGTGWGAGAKTLRIAGLSLVYSTPTPLRHQVGVQLSTGHQSGFAALTRIVTGCLRPTSTDRLPILSGIQPAELCQLGATLFLAYRESLDPDHILYGLLSGSSDARQESLRSRRPFVPAARNILDNLARLGIRAFEWTNHKWNAEYCENTFRLRVFISRISAKPVGMSLPRTAWVKLYHLWTGVGRFCFVHAQIGYKWLLYKTIFLHTAWLKKGQLTSNGVGTTWKMSSRKTCHCHHLRNYRQNP